MPWNRKPRPKTASDRSTALSSFVSAAFKQLGCSPPGEERSEGEDGIRKVEGTVAIRIATLEEVVTTDDVLNPAETGTGGKGGILVVQVTRQPQDRTPHEAAAVCRQVVSVVVPRSGRTSSAR